jgi:hypothetical protein
MHRLPAVLRAGVRGVQARTFWSLSNAFTSAFKKLDLIPAFNATAKLGPFIEQFNESGRQRASWFRLPQQSLNGAADSPLHFRESCNRARRTR